MRRLNIRIVAFFLAILFTQKMGLGICLHDWLHENKSNAQQIKNAALQKYQIKCNCIDDALMPLVMDNAVAEIKVPEKQFASFINSHHSSLCSFIKEFRCLRGPPFGQQLT